MAALILGLGGFALLMAISVLSTMWKGYVLSVLWAWFAVPFGLPVLGVVQAMGIALLVTFLTYQHIATVKPEKSTSADATSTAILFPLASLGIGWCIKQFL